MSGTEKFVQITIDGEETDAERKRPATWIYCEECDEPILRSERYGHPHDLDGATAFEKAKIQELDEKVPDHAKLDTQTWEVTFHYEYVETVVVEASGRGEAKSEAREIRDFTGEYIDTIHTEKRSVSDPSQASIEYLERHNLLPDDHDLTREDIQRVLDGDRDA